MGWLPLVGPSNHRSVLQKSPIKETIFCKGYTIFTYCMIDLLGHIVNDRCPFSPVRPFFFFGNISTQIFNIVIAMSKNLQFQEKKLSCHLIV